MPPLPTCHLHNGQASALGAEEVMGEPIDENLELEDNKTVTDLVRFYTLTASPLV